MLEVVALYDFLAINDQGYLVVRSRLVELKLNAVSVVLQKIRKVHNSARISVRASSVNEDGVFEGDGWHVALGVGNFLVAVRVEINGAGHLFILFVCVRG